MPRLLLAGLVSLALLAPTASAQLSGLYTIDGAAPTAGTNYQTFAEATAALAAQGISGAVSFQVAAGTYSEQVTIPAVAGASASARVTFQGVPDGSGAKPVIRFSGASAATDWAIRVEGPFVALRTLRAIPANPFASYGTMVATGPDADAALLYDLEIVAPAPGFLAGDAYGVRVEGASTTLALLDVEGGTHGVAYLPAVSAPDAQHALVSSTVGETEDRGILVQGQTNLANKGVILQNLTVDHPSSGAGYVGLHLEDLGTGSAINRVVVTVGDGTGVRVETVDEGGERTDISNLTATVTGTGVPLDVSDTQTLALAYASLLAAGGSEPALRLDAASAGADVRNLILAHRGTGVQLDAPAGLAQAGDMAFDVTGRATPLSVSYDGTLYTDLPALQAASGAFNGSSLLAVVFADAAAGDLHLAGASDGDGRLIGQPLPPVPADLDGETRSTTYPYVGADEAPTPLTPPPPPLAGTYTMDAAGGADFASFEELFQALETRGVSAPVTVEVASGEYTYATGMQPVLEAYPGMSAAHPVAIVRAPGAATNPFVRPASIAYQLGIQFDGASHVTLDGIDAFRSVRTTATSSHITVRNGVFNATLLIAGSFHTIEDNAFGAFPIASNSSISLSADDSVVRGNVITDPVPNAAGHSAIFVSADRFTVENNAIALGDQSTSTIMRGVWARLGEGGRIAGNTVTRGTSDPTRGCLLIDRVRGAVTVDGNTLRCGDGLGIDAASNTFPSSNDSLTVTNNMVTVDEGSALDLDYRSPAALLVAHNTVVMFSPGASASALYRRASGGPTQILSNILLNIGGGTAVTYDTDPDAMNYNVLATASGPLVNSYADLAALQAATPYEDDGASFVPSFQDVFGGDFHLTSGSVGDPALGAPRLAEAPDDVDGDARPGVTYRGADEVAGTPLPQPPVFAVSSPLGGDYFVHGDPINVRWTTLDPEITPDDRIQIALVCTGQAPVVVVADRPNNGARGFLMPASVGTHGGPADPGGSCRAEVALVEDPTALGLSAPFVTQDPTLAVPLTEPERLDRYGVGDPFTFRWDAAALDAAAPGSTVDLRILCQGRPDFVAFTDRPNNGARGFLLPSDFGAYDTCHAEVAASADGAVFGRSPAVEILDVPLPSVEITAPVAGETLTAGAAYTVTWTTLSTDASVSLRVLLDDFSGPGVTTVRLAQTANDGAFTWSVPAGQAPGSAYRVRIAGFAQDGSRIVDVTGFFEIEAGGGLAPRSADHAGRRGDARGDAGADAGADAAGDAGGPPAGVPLERGWTRVVAPRATDAAAWLSTLLPSAGRVVARDDGGRTVSVAAGGAAGDLAALAGGAALDVWVDAPAVLGAAPPASGRGAAPGAAPSGGALAMPAALWRVVTPGLADGDAVTVLRGDAVVGRGVVAGGAADVVVAEPVPADGLDGALGLRADAVPQTPAAARRSALALRAEPAGGDARMLDVAALAARSGAALPDGAALAFVPGADWSVALAGDAEGRAAEARGSAAENVTLAGSMALPETLTLPQVVPNPARGHATVRVGLPEAAALVARVYDVRGRVVAVLADGAEAPAGWHDLNVPASRLAAGVYVVRVQTDGGAVMRRFTVVR